MTDTQTLPEAVALLRKSRAYLGIAAEMGLNGYHEYDPGLVEAVDAFLALPSPADALREALERIAAPKLIKDGPSTTCLRCGVETFHEKDGELQHEPDCAQQIARAALSTLEEGG